MSDNSQAGNGTIKTVILETYKGLLTGVVAVGGALLLADTFFLSLEKAKVKTNLTPNIQITRVLEDPFTGRPDAVPRFKVTNVGDYFVKCEQSCWMDSDNTVPAQCFTWALGNLGPDAPAIVEFSLDQKDPAWAVEGFDVCKDKAVRHFLFKCSTRQDLVKDVVKGLWGTDEVPKEQRHLITMDYKYAGSVRHPSWSTARCETQAN
ncbi:MAG: hypothetical protein AAGI11_22415 [Pseudomonadota bacterium]